MRNWGRACAVTLLLAAFTPALGARSADSSAAADRSRDLVDRGMALESQGRHDEALIDMTQAIEIHALPPSEQAHALFVRGAILDALGRVSDAVGDYSAALTLAPRYAPALNNRANAYRRQNRLAEAKRDYLASLSSGNLQPEYPYYGLGQIAEAAGNAQGARGFYAQAVAANPDYTLAADRLAALGGAPDGAPADTGVIHLRPPKSVQTTGPLVLKPPPPGPAASPRIVPASYGGSRAEPGLRPALDATGRSAQVQLGAWRTEDEAGQGWNHALRRSGGLLDGLSPHIVAVDLPGRGRYYRLRVGPVVQGPAKLCSALQAQGVDCIPARD